VSIINGCRSFSSHDLHTPLYYITCKVICWPQPCGWSCPTQVTAELSWSRSEERLARKRWNVMMMKIRCDMMATRYVHTCERTQDLDERHLMRTTSAMAADDWQSTMYLTATCHNTTDRRHTCDTDSQQCTSLQHVTTPLTNIIHVITRHAPSKYQTS